MLKKSIQHMEFITKIASNAPIVTPIWTLPKSMTLLIRKSIVAIAMDEGSVCMALVMEGSGVCLP